MIECSCTRPVSRDLVESSPVVSFQSQPPIFFTVEQQVKLEIRFTSECRCLRPCHHHCRLAHPGSNGPTLINQYQYHTDNRYQHSILTSTLRSLEVGVQESIRGTQTSPRSLLSATSRGISGSVIKKISNHKMAKVFMLSPCTSSLASGRG